MGSIPERFLVLSMSNVKRYSSTQKEGRFQNVSIEDITVRVLELTSARRFVYSVSLLYAVTLVEIILTSGIVKPYRIQFVREIHGIIDHRWHSVCQCLTVFLCFIRVLYVLKFSIAIHSPDEVFFSQSNEFLLLHKHIYDKRLAISKRHIFVTFTQLTALSGRFR